MKKFKIILLFLMLICSVFCNNTVSAADPTPSSAGSTVTIPYALKNNGTSTGSIAIMDWQKKGSSSAASSTGSGSTTSSYSMDWQKDGASSAASSTGTSGGSGNLKGSHVGDKDQEKDCSLDSMREKYLPNNGMDIDSCWYCKVVTIMTNAFLSAAVSAMSICIELGLIILRLGFLIWLAYYILQQVSSVAPIKLGEMLQAILLMGFKVALATLLIKYAQDTLAPLLVNPIMLTGIDYGGRILDGVMSMGSAGGG